MDVITLAHFNPELVNISEPRAGAPPSRVKFLDVTYGPERRKLMIQLPSMRVPFESLKNETGPSVVVSFDDEHLTEKLKTLDDKLLQFATERSESFFGSFKQPDIVKEKFNVIIKEKAGFKPILQSKLLVTGEGGVRTPIFRSDGSRSTVDDLKKNARCTLVLSVPCVYIGGTGFGFSKKAERIRVDQEAVDSDSFAFVDDTSEHGDVSAADAFL